MRQFSPLSLAVPAGTAQAAPVSKTWALYPGWVHRFEIEIPRGHRGLTGVRISYNGTPVIPFDLAQWLVSDGRVFVVPWEDEIQATGLVVQGFNTDNWPHTFYLYADVDPHLPGEAPAGVISPRAGGSNRSQLETIALLSYAGGGP